jgi:hypothetical protein
MFGWPRREPAAAAPLTGAPSVRRQKTYSADTGYVYQYYYQGYRVISLEGSAATEFVFSVSADRKSMFPVSVVLPDDAAAAWERTHDRDLNSTERYAIAKMALFAAFDACQHPREMREAVAVRADGVADLLEKLGIN